MRTKLVNQDPFTSGTEHAYWTARNCDRCWKAAHYCEWKDDYTVSRCSIDRDIFTRMMCNDPIAQRTIDITRMKDCPLRQKYRKPYKPKEKTLTIQFENYD